MYFDSPAKTVSELRWALELGLSINADSVEELKRIDAVLTERGPSRPSSSTIGLRVNPIVHGGSIGIFAVSNSPDGKFGHPLHSREARDAVLQAFTDFPWLCGLHAHVGSAGTSLPMLATGASTLVELARDVDEHCSAGSTPRVTMLDIGGGLASNMDSELVTPTFGEYAQVLERAARLRAAAKAFSLRSKPSTSYPFFAKRSAIFSQFQDFPMPRMKLPTSSMDHSSSGLPHTGFVYEFYLYL